MMSSSNLVKTRRRTFSEPEDSHKLLTVKSDDRTTGLKKSLSSKTLEISSLPISTKNDLSSDCYDSLEDLNREIENFCPFNAMPLNVANSRYYCDIFSRQSIGSEDANSSPEMDDVERIKFLASIPDNGCEIIQLIPKKPNVIPNAMYQPCTNHLKILKSSCSAFRDISEIKIVKSPQTDSEEQERITRDKDGDDDESSSSQAQARE